uniref:Uncharacterized protein n=1 Tax=Steinernema glaseri TaxID=37863 RepID=A0A1I7Y6T9_9BILA
MVTSEATVSITNPRTTQNCLNTLDAIFSIFPINPPRPHMCGEEEIRGIPSGQTADLQTTSTNHRSFLCLGGVAALTLE